MSDEEGKLKGSVKVKKDYEVGRGKPPKHGQIKKGEVRNPRGAATQTNRITQTAMKRLTTKELEELLNAALFGDISSLKKIIDERDEEGKHSTLKVWVASIVMKAIVKGEMGPLTTLLERMLGKVPDKVEHSGNVDGANKFQVEFVDNNNK